MDNQNLSIEQAFEELDKIIASMQTEELSLEDTFAMYKKGLALVENCNKRIEKIQCDIEQLNTDEDK